MFWNELVKHISHHNCNGCKNTGYLGDKITKKVGNSLYGWGVRVWSALLAVGVVVLMGIKVGIGITKIATWICKEISEHIKLSKPRLS